MNIIKVGMADYQIAKRPDALTTLGLGSCIGICLYDRTTGIIGMAHIMLPSSKAVVRSVSEGINIAKFADTAIPSLINEMIRNGVRRTNLVAKIAGGARMFAYTSTNDLMRVGERNADMCKLILKGLNIPLVAEDTGGTFGRTIELYSEDGSLLIKAIGKDKRVI